MDISSAATITAAVTAAAGSAGNAAGQQAWESLLTLVRRATHRGEPAATPPAPVDPADEQQVRELIGTVIQQSAQDPQFAAQLDGWAREHLVVLHIHEDHSTVRNTVSEGAQASGFFQGRDVNGTLNIKN